MSFPLVRLEITKLREMADVIHKKHEEILHQELKGYREAIKDVKPFDEVWASWKKELSLALKAEIAKMKEEKTVTFSRFWKIPIEYPKYTINLDNEIKFIHGVATDPRVFDEYQGFYIWGCWYSKLCDESQNRLTTFLINFNSSVDKDRAVWRTISEPDQRSRYSKILSKLWAMLLTEKDYIDLPLALVEEIQYAYKN